MTGTRVLPVSAEVAENKLFSYRNVTHNGCLHPYAWPEAKVDAKLAELAEKHPGVVFEKVEVKVVEVTKTGWVPGSGRAGNSYKTSWKVRTIQERV